MGTLDIVGFCNVEVKLLGPFQEYVAPAIVLADKLSVLPEQTGELLDAEGAAGSGVTETVTIPAGPVHPAAEVVVTE